MEGGEAFARSHRPRASLPARAASLRHLGRPLRWGFLHGRAARMSSLAKAPRRHPADDNASKAMTELASLPQAQPSSSPPESPELFSVGRPLMAAAPLARQHLLPPPPPLSMLRHIADSPWLLPIPPRHNPHCRLGPPIRCRHRQFCPPAPPQPASCSRR